MTNFSHHTTKKGAHMSDREQSPKHTAKTPSPRTGIFATLRALLNVQGTSAPATTPTTQAPARPHARRLPLAILTALALTSLAFASSASATPPTPTMGAISNVSYTSAHVEGHVTLGDGGGAAYYFEYCADQFDCTEEASWTKANPGAFQLVSEDKSVSNEINGLKGGTKYFVRLFAEDFVGEADRSDAPHPDFTTLVVDPPTIPGAVEASPVFSTSATASGKVKRPANADPAFDVTACRFEYVTQGEWEANSNAFPGGAPFVPCDPATPYADPNGETTVTASLSGLAPATTYHLRLAAENAAPGVVTKDASNFTTAAKVAAPTVTTLNDASEVKFDSAKFSGNVVRPAGDDPALNVKCHFEYVTHAQFLANEGASEPVFTGAQTADCTPNPITSPGEATVSAKVGLVATTKYHFRLVAENEGGSDTMDAAITFTTPEAELPTVTIDPVAGGTFTTAHVSGKITVDTPGRFMAPFFEISTDNTNWTYFESANGLFPGQTEKVIEKDFSGLEPSTTYFFRICATYGGGSGYDEAVANGEMACSPEPNPSITTEPPQASPTAENLAVTDVTATTAHFSGTVNPNAPAGPLSPLVKKAYETKWHFECTPVCLDANENVIGGTVQGEEGPQTVTGDVKRLEPKTPYEVRLIVSSEGGGETKTETFLTDKSPPSVKQTLGSSDGTGGYTLQGIVDANNETITDCTFEWGPDVNQFAFSADCSPMPTPRAEVQKILIIAGGGQFRLSYHGQATGDIDHGAAASVLEAELQALSMIGAGNVKVTQNLFNKEFASYTVSFTGALAETDALPIGVENGTAPLLAPNASIPASWQVTTPTPGGKNLPITVEAHLTGLTPDAIYHSLLVVTYGAGLKQDSGEPQEFKATLAAKERCANEQLRAENSSFALPECRAYEMVTPPGKEGFGTFFAGYDGGARLAYESRAGNIAKSGQAAAGKLNQYVAARTASGWETIPNLNGSSGSFRDAPLNVDSGFNVLLRAYSSDLLSSVWVLHRQGEAAQGLPLQLRSPDGTFARIQSEGGFGTDVVASADLSHVVTAWSGSGTGPGVYDSVGTGNDQPRRVDVDNSGAPIPACATVLGRVQTRSVSSDGSRIFLRAFGGCGAANPPVGEIWARVNGTASFDVSASHCNRTAADPGGVCNGPTEPGGCVEGFNSSTGDVEGIGCRPAKFAAATPDGSRVFFTTTQQLVNADTDQTNDIYACDIPSGNPAPSAEKANHCAAFRQVSAGDPTGADVERFDATSANGTTVLFTAKGKLVDNEDALGEKAVAGDHNLYVWRIDAANPDGQTAFVGRLDANDLGSSEVRGGGPQITPDGRYLVFTTGTQLLDTDTDIYRDVYRYDADTGGLTRASTNVFGLAGNGNGFDAAIPGEREPILGDPRRLVHPAVSDDGTKIVFTTTEALSAADGNAEPDVYLWTPARVSLISTGSSGSAPGDELGPGGIRNPKVAIDPSGQDVYFESAQPLTPADGDSANDVYDARIGGGFSFAPKPVCTGEKCQPDPRPAPPQKTPLSAQPGAGNPAQPKPCLKGKVRKKNGKCAKKPKKHSGKKHSGKKASHKQGGGK